MSGVKHTPGLTIRDYGEPVTLEAAECQFALMDGPDGAPVAYVYRIEDATIYAAAPDLLEALVVARTAIHQAYVDWDGEPEDAVPLQLARAKCDAAIARATGDRPEKGGAL